MEPGRDLSESSARGCYLRAEALEQAADYHGALTAWTEGYERCLARDLAEAAQVCLARMLAALRNTGQWDRAVELSRQLLRARTTQPARMVAAVELGLILTARGRSAAARPHLLRSSVFAAAHRMFRLELDASWGLARADASEGKTAVAAERLSQLVRRCAEHDGHGAEPALRWATSFFSRRGLAAELSACTDVLSRRAEATNAPNAVAGARCAVGEQALIADDPNAAAQQFEQALVLLAPLGLLAEHAEVQVRAGVALAAAGQRAKALTHLLDSHATACQLRAEPLARTAANELTMLGADASTTAVRAA